MTNEDGVKRFYGKYRGTVIQNIDPEQRGRLQVTVTDPLTLIPSTWAEACVPLAGPTGPPMGSFFLPPIGAGVWIEFEHGDVNKPIWVGCRFGTAPDVPPISKLAPPFSPAIVLQTAGQHAIAISDLPGPTGGIMLKSATGAAIIVNDTGIYIQNGKGATITLVGTAIDFNAGALTVLK
jgi:uncharacterized protein involved in type VI secretion and phage assembly